MENDFIRIIATQGIFALLFCYLLLYVLKENSKREEQYQHIIGQLTESLPKIKSDINNIKNELVDRI